MNKIEIKKLQKCEDCKGFGEVSVMEKVYPGEPHEALIGSAKCENCSGTGEEQDDDIVKIRILDELNKLTLEDLIKIIK